MHKSRFSRILISLALVVTLLCSFSLTAVMAADGTPTPTPTPTPTGPPELKMTCDIPAYSEASVTSFYYNVYLTYSGNDTVTVNLSTTAPQGWTSWVTYAGKQITSVPIGPFAYGSPDSKTLSLSLSPAPGKSPEPGEYTVTLKATAGALSQSIDLTGILRARYGFSINTASGNLATKATAGKVNNLAVEMFNTGSVALDSISLNSYKPEGWIVTFEPAKVDSLGAGQTAQANVVITPPKDKTIAGDYNITLSASNNNVSSSIVIRVTVETPAIWGTVALIVIVLVIAGLAVLFLKLGRR